MIFSRNWRNTVLTSRIHAQIYPKSRYPEPHVFKRLKSRFEGTGNVIYEKHERRKQVTNHDQMMVVLSLLRILKKVLGSQLKNSPVNASSISRMWTFPIICNYCRITTEELLLVNGTEYMMHQSTFFNCVAFPW